MILIRLFMNTPIWNNQHTEFLREVLKLIEIEGELKVNRFENYISVVSLQKDDHQITLEPWVWIFPNHSNSTQNHHHYKSIQTPRKSHNGRT